MNRYEMHYKIVFLLVKKNGHIFHEVISRKEMTFSCIYYRLAMGDVQISQKSIRNILFRPGSMTSTTVEHYI